jgi:N-acyl homoserine lactone hydrolase
MKSVLGLAMLVMLAACAGTGRDGAVERMYVINCGENRANDISRWTPGVNVGKAGAFSNHCYLVQHAKGLMLWDSGNPDRLAALPNGLTNPAGTITAFMRKPLTESLKEIGVTPAIIQHFAMSHSHGDHSGNANLFASSTLYMQEAEYNAVFGPEPQKFNFIAGNFAAFQGKRVKVLKGGDHDVFGDGSVIIKPAPGHTPGHQVLVVRLPKTGPVMLSGDMVHLTYSWENRVVPPFNFDVAQSGRTIDELKAYTARTGTQLWVNHDMEQSARIPKSPAFVE